MESTMSEYEAGESTEGILNLVSKDNATTIWKDSPDAILYLEYLSSLGIQRLAEEPERLSEEKTYIVEQTQDLAFHNYKTFIQTADCSREIYEDFTLVENRLQVLLDKVPLLNEQCQRFSKQTQEINRKWRQSSLMLSKHPQLLEILEIPQIMDTCVRNTYYEEALDLAAYVQRLERKHGSISIIKNIATQVEASQQLMLSHILQALRASIKLPECLRLVNYLRRMNVFSEAQLRMKFLQARDAWFQGLLSAIPKDDNYVHITKVIELNRVHLFDIITQYRAVFTDDDLSTLFNKEKRHSESNIFYSWLMLKICDFQDQLVKDLSTDISSRLDSVLSQSMYFGLSFSRVGVDFRPLLVPVFHQAIISRFQSSIKDATKQFEHAMESFTLLSLPSPVPSSLLSSSISEDSSPQPPLGLLEFTPLAHYCNSVLTALNDLRLCAPITLAHDISSVLANSFEMLVNVVSRFHKAEEKSFTAVEQTSFERFCVQLSSHLFPHITSCLDVLFPPSQIVKVLGIHATESHVMKGISHFDLKPILEPIWHLLPEEKIEDDDAGITITVPSETVIEETASVLTDTSVNTTATINNQNELQPNAHLDFTDTAVLPVPIDTVPEDEPVVIPSVPDIKDDTNKTE